jgi:transposase-like protein
MNQTSSPAAQLQPHQRQQIALRVLTKQETISGMAEEEGVSRKFLYKQGHIAQNVLTLAFEKPKKNEDVLFYLPVTQKWLSQLILALILICHCSYRGVVELLRDLFDYSISSELKIREEGSYKGIKAFKKALSKQDNTLLAFSAILDQKLQEIAQAQGMETLWQAGLRRALRGETTLEEILRVVGMEGF